MLELTCRGGSCVSIPVTFFPLCPSYWEIQPPIKIQKISLEDLPSTKLSIEWPGFKVINKLAGIETHEPPRHVSSSITVVFLFCVLLVILIQQSKSLV
jgi:hypothetical protein